MKNKKGQVFDKMSGLFIGLATIAIVSVVMFIVMAQAQDQLVSLDGIDESNTSTMTLGYNATVQLQEAMDDVPGWIPLIVIAVMGGILVGLVAYFKSVKS